MEDDGGIEGGTELILLGGACIAGGASISTGVYSVSSYGKDKLTGSYTSESEFNAGLSESAFRGASAGATVFGIAVCPPAGAAAAQLSGGGTAAAASAGAVDTLVSVIPQIIGIEAAAEMLAQGGKAMLSKPPDGGDAAGGEEEGVYIEDGESKSWLGKENGVVDPKSTKNFGHTFTTHGAGEKNTKALLGRARGTNTPQGQWLNNQEVAEYLNKYGVIEYSQPPQEISIPEGLVR